MNNTCWYKKEEWCSFAIEDTSSGHICWVDDTAALEQPRWRCEWRLVRVKQGCRFIYRFGVLPVFAVTRAVLYRNRPESDL